MIKVPGPCCCPSCNTCRSFLLPNYQAECQFGKGGCVPPQPLLIAQPCRRASFVQPLADSFRMAAASPCRSPGRAPCSPARYTLARPRSSTRRGTVLLELLHRRIAVAELLVQIAPAHHDARIRAHPAQPMREPLVGIECERRALQGRDGAWVERHGVGQQRFENATSRASLGVKTIFLDKLTDRRDGIGISQLIRSSGTSFPVDR
jgi:hypothetical protein